jgi:hypothetical protein
LNEQEHHQFSEMAKEHGLTLSDVVRVMMLRAQPVNQKSKPDRALFIRTLGELGKIGSNVNQIAYELHRQRIVGNGHHVPDRIIKDASASVKALSDHLLSILQDGVEG